MLRFGRLHLRGAVHCHREAGFCIPRYAILQTSEIGVTLNIAAGRWVRFTPESGHRNSVVECPLCAKSRHQPEQRGALSRGKHRVTIWRFLQLLGAVCLVIVVLTHIAEVFQIFPTMGWGLPNSAGTILIS